METWVLITVAAAFAQNLRTTFQKHLKGAMGTTGATFVRFGFGVPFALIFLALIAWLGGFEVPAPNAAFLLWVVVAGGAQIGAQALLLMVFSYRNFVVGNAYSRTEPIQAALFGLIFLGEKLGLGALVAVAVAVVGVLLISMARTGEAAGSLWRGLFTRPAALGLASGAMFGIAAVGYRAASLSLGGPGFMMQAATTLVWAIALQSLALIVWMAWRERDQFAKIARAWKLSLATGFVGATASFGWFAAMTLQQAAIVKAVAQVEMLFAIATSVLFFKEKITGMELAGVGLIVAGIVALVLGGF